MPEALPHRANFERSDEIGGEAGIRTLGTAFRPYNGLANRRLQPLGHLTAPRKYTAEQRVGAKRIVRRAGEPHRHARA